MCSFKNKCCRYTLVCEQILCKEAENNHYFGFCKNCGSKNIEIFDSNDYTTICIKCYQPGSFVYERIFAYTNKI
jgi:hypothetical protein